ncbi:hypothetical protein EDD11_005503 [Mortierella claussenii]|nr:hypothetical protein EDD11_005503 [Mortierella claussenii]
MLRFDGTTWTSLRSLHSVRFAPNINVRGRVDKIFRAPFKCLYGSGDYAMGFVLHDPQTNHTESVFLFHPQIDRLPIYAQSRLIEIRGATLKYCPRFGREIRLASDAEGGWNYVYEPWWPQEPTSAQALATAFYQSVRAVPLPSRLQASIQPQASSAAPRQGLRLERLQPIVRLERTELHTMPKHDVPSKASTGVDNVNDLTCVFRDFGISAHAKATTA